MLECLAHKSTLSFQKDVCITITSPRTFLFTQIHSKVTLPSTRLCIRRLFSNNGMLKNYFTPMYEVNQERCISKQVVVFGLNSIKFFYESLKFAIQATITPTRLSHGKLACILLYVVSAHWSISGGFSILLTFHIMNMFSPRYSGSSTSTQIKLSPWVEWARQQL